MSHRPRGEGVYEGIECKIEHDIAIQNISSVGNTRSAGEGSSMKREETEGNMSEVKCADNEE